MIEFVVLKRFGKKIERLAAFDSMHDASIFMQGYAQGSGVSCKYLYVLINYLKNESSEENNDNQTN